MFFLDDLYMAVKDSKNISENVYDFWKTYSEDIEIKRNMIPHLETVKGAMVWSCVFARLSGIKVWYETGDSSIQQLFLDVQEIVHEYMGTVL